MEYLLALFVLVKYMDVQMSASQIPENPQHATTYLTLLYDVAPLIIMAFVISMFRGWAGVKRSYLHENFWWTLFNILLTSAVMSTLAVGVVLILPVFNIDVSAAGGLGIILVMSSLGSQGVDYVMKRYVVGARTISPFSADSLAKVKAGMTPAQQEQHRKACPFFKDCVKDCEHCGNCPKNGVQDAKNICKTNCLR